MAGCSLRLRQLPEVPAAHAAPAEEAALLASAAHPDPQRLLGPQVVEGGAVVVVRCWVSGAEAVSLLTDVLLPTGGPDAKEDTPSRAKLGPAAGCPESCPWLFEAAFEVEAVDDVKSSDQLRAAWAYQLEVQYCGGGKAMWADPYSLGLLLPEAELEAWAAGKPSACPASTFGAHHMDLGSLRPGLWGTRFAIWAPHARSVSVVGDFNFWDGRAHPMCRRSAFGVWELFLPVWDLRGQKYGYQISPDGGGAAAVKADPFALEFVDPSDGGHDAKVPQCDDFSRAAWGGAFAWSDATWLRRRAEEFGPDRWALQPLSIYEVHLGSWMLAEEGGQLGYRDIAEPLAKHVKDMGFVAVELLPLSQYPADESWGYQCAAGLFAVDSRLGSPDDFRYLVDTLHRHSIAVFLDFVAAHFAKDPWGLVAYSGAPQFEYEGALGDLADWGTARFDYGKPEVRSYLLGAAEHWIDHFHVDGLRLDAVAAMVYSSFGREEDGDAILAGKGVVNQDGVSLLRELCARVREKHPGVLLAAEESTNFKWVTSRPVEPGTERSSAQVEDLGFHLKWNMGFTYDTLAFLGSDAAARPHLETFGWKKLAFYLAYAFNERWVLPFSHDNAHPRGLLEQTTSSSQAEVDSQFAHMRMLLAYTVGMPGRPLLFMGAELGEPGWSYKRAIDWEAARNDPRKQRLRRWVAKLLRLYRELPALHRQDDDAAGFAWLDKDASDRCIFAWRRSAEAASDVVVIVNASPEAVSGYRIAAGPSETGRWRLVASTSSADQGDDGDGEGEGGAGEATEVSASEGHFTVDLPGCAAQLWLACEKPETESVRGGAAAGSPRLEFWVTHAKTACGDSVRVVGGCAELGRWQPKEGLVLATSPETFPVWRAEVDLPANSTESIEFKVVVVKADGSAVWEPIDANRCVSPAAANGGGSADGSGRRAVCAKFGVA